MIAIAALDATGPSSAWPVDSGSIPLASPSHPANVAKTTRSAKEAQLRARAWATTHPELMERARMIRAWEKNHRRDDDDAAKVVMIPPLPCHEELENWYHTTNMKWKCLGGCNRRFKTAGELFRHQGMDRCGNGRGHEMARVVS
jgi:hypothetical protein